MTQNLQKEIIGVTIKTVGDDKWNLIYEGSTKKEEFKGKVLGVGRRGKYLWIEVEKGAILLHMGFTGWVIPLWAKERSPRRFLHPMDPARHTRWKMLTDKGEISMTDPRCLSGAWLFKNLEDLRSDRRLKRIGPDADSEEGLKRLKDKIRGTKKRIRDVLLDQQEAAGIGNYLCCEILHAARLHGAIRGVDLKEEQTSNLLEKIKEIIQQAEETDSKEWWQVFSRKITPDGYPVTREVWGRRGYYTSRFHSPPPEGYELEMQGRKQ